MVDHAGNGELRIPRLLDQRRAASRAFHVDRPKRFFAKVRPHPGVITGHLVRNTPVDHRLQPGRSVEAAQVVLDGGHMASGEGDEPAGFQLHRAPARRSPAEGPHQDAFSEVEMTLVGKEPAHRKVQRLIGHEKTDDLCVRQVQHDLPIPGVRVCDLPIDDGGLFEEAVDVRARGADAPVFLEVPPHPEVAVPEGKNRLISRSTGRFERRLTNHPCVGGIQGIDGFCGCHAWSRLDRSAAVTHGQQHGQRGHGSGSA